MKPSKAGVASLTARHRLTNIPRAKHPALASRCCGRLSPKFRITVNETKKTLTNTNEYKRPKCLLLAKCIFCRRTSSNKASYCYNQWAHTWAGTALSSLHRRRAVLGAMSRKVHTRMSKQFTTETVITNDLASLCPDWSNIKTITSSYPSLGTLRSLSDRVYLVRHERM